MAADAKAAPLSRAELEQKIVALAWKDDAFRKAFLADPKGQFEKRLGTKLPAGLSMTAHAEDDSHLHFVIPAKPKNLSALSDADLEKVAGGVDVVITVISVLATATGVASAGTIAALTIDMGIKDAGGPGWQHA